MTTQAMQGQSAQKILIIDNDDNHAQRLTQRLQGRSLILETCQAVRDALRKLGQQADLYELVIINITDSSRPWERIVQDLQEAAAMSKRQQGPSYLCVSRFRKPLLIQLMLERKGARVSYEG